MKCSFGADAAVSAITVLSRLCPSPAKFDHNIIFKSVLIEADQGQLSLTAFSRQSRVRVWFEAEVSEPGQVVCNRSVLSLPSSEGRLDISLVGENLVISTGAWSVSSRLSVLDPADVEVGGWPAETEWLAMPAGGLPGLIALCDEYILFSGEAVAVYDQFYIASAPYDLGVAATLPGSAKSALSLAPDQFHFSNSRACFSGQGWRYSCQLYESIRIPGPFVDAVHDFERVVHATSGVVPETVCDQIERLMDHTLNIVSDPPSRFLIYTDRGRLRYLFRDSYTVVEADLGAAPEGSPVVIFGDTKMARQIIRTLGPVSIYIASIDGANQGLIIFEAKDAWACLAPVHMDGTFAQEVVDAIVEPG